MNQQTSQRAWMRAANAHAVGMPAGEIGGPEPAAPVRDAVVGVVRATAAHRRRLGRTAHRAVAWAVGLHGCIASYKWLASGERGEISDQLQAVDVPRTLRQRPFPALSGGAIQ